MTPFLNIMSNEQTAMAIIAAIVGLFVVAFLVQIIIRKLAENDFRK